jgi:CBS domain-containing protein
MVDLKVHRLFVVDDLGTLVGVITVLDVLRHLTVA